MKCPSVLIVEEIEPFLCFVQEEMEAKIKHVDTIFCLLSTYLQNFKIFKIYNLIMGLWEYEKKKKKKKIYPVRMLDHLIFWFKRQNDKTTLSGPSLNQVD